MFGWAVLLFTIPLLAPVVPALAVSFSLFGRANRMADEYVAARAAATNDPFGPRPLHQPWYSCGSFTGFLQRISRDVSLYRTQADPAIEALRKRALRASWQAPVAFPLTFAVVIAVQMAVWALLLGR